MPQETGKHEEVKHDSDARPTGQQVAHINHCQYSRGGPNKGLVSRVDDLL
jgi:hypothetical protein